MRAEARDLKEALGAPRGRSVRGEHLTGGRVLPPPARRGTSRTRPRAWEGIRSGGNAGGNGRSKKPPRIASGVLWAAGWVFPVRGERPAGASRAISGRFRGLPATALLTELRAAERAAIASRQKA